MPEYAPVFSLEERQSFAISQLELWKQCDIDADAYDAAAVRDPNHTKLLQYQDRTLPAKEGSRSGSEMKAEKMKKAIESATKAAAELSMLVQLTTLIQSNKILSLQTFYSGVSLSAHEEVGAGGSAVTKPSESIRELWNLPIAQRIDIQRKTFTKAKSTLSSGLERCKELIAKRQGFADTIAHCQEERGFRLCSVETGSGRRVVRRPYDSKKDFIAIDCSVTVASTGGDGRSTIAAAGGSAASAVAKRPALVSGAASVASAESSSDMYTRTAFVPILMGKCGVELGPGEKCAPARTLQMELLWNKRGISHPHNHSQGAIQLPSAAEGDFVTLCSHRVWDLLPAAESGTHDWGESGARQGTAAVAQVTAHCQRRHHETLCCVLFERLQRECADGATEWDVLTGAPGAVRAGGATGAGAGLAEHDVRHLHKVLAEERMGKGITVVSSVEDRLVLRISDTVLLVLSMQPIAAAGPESSLEGGEAGAMEVILSTDPARSRVVTSEERVLQQRASGALLGALLHLLHGPPVGDCGEADGDAPPAQGAHGAEVYWGKLAHSAQAAKSGTGKNVLVVRLLQAVRDGLQEVRGMHARR
jgi:hypothetical protein